MVIYGGFRFCNTYLKTVGTKFNSIYLFNSNQIIVVQPVNCCSYGTNIVSNTIQTRIPCIFMLIYSIKNAF